MSYGLKYYSEFFAENGNLIRVEILEKDYSGSTKTILLDGQNPISIYSSKKDKFEVIRGTGCYVNIVQKDTEAFEFMNLFNASDKEFKVKIFDNYNIKSLRYSGYIQPELFTQSLTTNATTVKVPCSDSIGYLESVQMQDLIQGTGLSGIEMKNQVKKSGYYYKVKDILISIFREISEKPLIKFYSTLQHREFFSGYPFARNLMELHLDIDTFKNLNALEFLEKMFLNHRIYQTTLVDDEEHDFCWQIVRYKDIKNKRWRNTTYDGTTVKTSTEIKSQINFGFQQGIGTLERESGIRKTNIKIPLQAVENLIDFENLTQNISTYNTVPNFETGWTTKPPWGSVKRHNSVLIYKAGDGEGYTIYSNPIENYNEVGIVIPIKNTILFDNTREDKINLEVTYELPEGVFENLRANKYQIISNMILTDVGKGDKMTQTFIGSSDLGYPVPYFFTSVDFDNFSPELNTKTFEIDYNRIKFDTEERIIKHSIQINLFNLWADLFPTNTFPLGYLSGDEIDLTLVLPVLQFGTNDTVEGYINQPYFLRNIVCTYEEEKEEIDEYEHIDTTYDRRTQDFDLLTHSEPSNEYANNVYYIFNNDKKNLTDDWVESGSTVYNTYENSVKNDIISFTNESKLQLKMNLKGTLSGTTQLPFIYQNVDQGTIFIENKIKSEPVNYTVEGFNLNLKKSSSQLNLSEIDEVLPSCSIYSTVETFFDSIIIKAFSINSEPEFSINGVDWFDANVENRNVCIFSGLTEGSYTTYVREKTRTCEVTQEIELIYDCTLSLTTTSVNETENLNDGRIAMSVAGNQSVAEFALLDTNDNIIRDWQTGTVFDNLSGGTYVVKARESSFTTCEVEREVTILAYDAELIEVEIIEVQTSDDTGGSNGTATIIIDNDPGDPEYQIKTASNIVEKPWQDSNFFTGLSARNYFAEVRSKSNTDNYDLVLFSIEEDIPPPDETKVNWSNLTLTAPGVTINNFYWTENGGLSWTEFTSPFNETYTVSRQVGIKVNITLDCETGGGVEIRLTDQDGNIIQTSGNGGFCNTVEAELIFTVNPGQYDELNFSVNPT
ncbi:MAG: hypothetical protein ACOC4B_00490 [Bacteroidota bacterium]